MNRLERRALDAGQRHMMEREARVRHRMMRAGEWPGWNHKPIEPGEIPGAGWAGAMREAWENQIYAVLSRPFMAGGLEMTHLAIRSFFADDIPWRDKMRIKDELCGAQRHAVEIFPARALLVDAANMYHLWVYPETYVPPFCLKD